MSITGLAETFQSIALSGSLLLAITVAAIAGLIAFLSPCVLPIVPGYLGYVSGLAGQGLKTTKSTGQAPGSTGKARRSATLFREGTGRMMGEACCSSRASRWYSWRWADLLARWDISSRRTQYGSIESRASSSCSWDSFSWACSLD